MAAPQDTNKAKIEAMLQNEALINATARNIFKSYDVDENGFLDRHEIAKIYERFAQDLKVPTPSNEELDDIYDHMDKDKDGMVSLPEFVEIFKVASQHFLEGKLYVPKK